MAEYTFYTHPMSRGQIARWALHEVAADYEAVIIDWKDKPAALLAANPIGKVPVIVHHAVCAGGQREDRPVSESAAICAYLAAMHPAAGLLPTEAETAAYFRWLFFAAGPLETAITLRGLELEVPTDKQGMAGWGSFERTLDMLEKHFATKDYVCGARFTMADVYVGSQVDWGLTFKTMPERAAFTAYAERLRARPAYRAAKAIDMALIAQMPK